MSQTAVFYYVLPKKKGTDFAMRRLATLEAIERLGGEAIKETARVVDSAELDDAGFVKVPTVDI
jgi:hypothetical protein